MSTLLTSLIWKFQRNR